MSILLADKESSSKIWAESELEKHIEANTFIDKAGKVRDSEALDSDAVTQWLLTQPIAVSGRPIVTQYAGGISNWTYRLQYNNRDLILRRPPTGTKAHSAHNMRREFKVQRALADNYPYMPEMVALCTDHSIIGCDFYVMEPLVGIIPRANLPTGLNLSRNEIHTLCTNMIDALIKLHSIDPKSIPELASLGKGEGYCQRQLAGWEKRYKKAKTINSPRFSVVRHWLKHNIPKDSRICVIHNDWRFDNIILDVHHPAEIIGVLDWEMATIGDPLMDLGGSLAYWVQPDDSNFMRQSRRQPTHLDGMMTRNEVVQYYLNKTGMDGSNWAFYEVFGLFRLAVIIQQIYYRYYHKQTRNPTFKNFWVIIHALNIRALKVIAKHESYKALDSSKLPKPFNA